MRIHLEGNKYIISDGYSMEIYSITKAKNKKGEIVERKQRLTGYCTDLEHLFKSYKTNHILSSDIEGELEDLMQMLARLERKIETFTRIAEKAVRESGDDKDD